MDTVVLVVQVLLFLLVCGCMARIAMKAGYPWWYSLFMLIPVVNLIVLVRFAFAEWPLEYQAYLYRMKEADGELHDPGYLLKQWLKKAVALEKAGKVAEAIRLYEKIAADPRPGNAELARAAIARLKGEPGNAAE